jgi:hypothetical protein
MTVLKGSLRPGGSWSLATDEALSLAHSELARGWMVAHAGPESAIISATTDANVIIKRPLKKSDVRGRGKPT